MPFLFYCIVVSVGVLTMVLGFAASVIGGTVIQMSITFISACGAPAMTMFLLGVFLPFINWIVSIKVLITKP